MSPPATSTRPAARCVIELLESLNRESGSTVVLVTHDLALAARANRIIRLGDGRLVSDTSRTDRPPARTPSPAGGAHDRAA